MTQRTNAAHKRKELTAAAFTVLANKGLSKKTTGVDGVAKSFIAKKAGSAAEQVAEDPDLGHPDEWDRPVD